MRATRRIGRSATRWLVVLSLTACGGGGGSAGGGGGGDRPTFSLSTNELRFSTISPGVTPGPGHVTGSVSGALSGTLYIKADVSGSVVANVFINISGSSGVATILPVKASTLGPGTFSGTLTVSACLNDPTCGTGQLAGSPATVNVSASGLSRP